MTAYAYDSKNRVTMVQRFLASGSEDPCQRVTYSYGSTATSDNRLLTAQYGSGGTCASYGGITVPSFTESYSYNAPGSVINKTVASSALGSTPASVTYTYDTYGRSTSVQYPFYRPSSPTTFTTAYDAMGRPNSLTDSTSVTWVQNVAYDYAGRLQNIQFLSTTKTLAYNTSGQLASLNWSTTGGYSGMTGGLQYSYSATQNNGQITQVTDTLSGETIVYQYDVLKRVTSASSTPTAGSSTPAWNEQFSYDGFGNLTGKTLNGTLQPIPVTAATNQLQNATYDANGNTTSGAGATAAYNVDNRMISAQETSGGIEYCFYAPDGKRVWRQLVDGTQQVTFYGAYGEKLGVFTDANLTCICGILQMNVSFAGSLIWQGVPGAGAASAVLLDRLGSNRNGARFYPYGDEITSTANDREKFATYTRDTYTTFDYADQRFYASTYRRFNSPDPYTGSMHPRSPLSWNRYSYTAGDPINSNDPTGQDGFTLPTVAAGNADTTYVAGAGNSCPAGQNNVGVISGTACLDTTAVLENSVISSITGLSTPGVNGPVEDWGTTFSIDVTGSGTTDSNSGSIDDSSTGQAQYAGTPIEDLPNSFWIEPAVNGPRIRVFGPDGTPTFDIDYQGNHPDVGNPHIHRWDPDRLGPEPVDPRAVPPEPVVPPGTVGRYSPWPRKPVPVLQEPAAPGTTVSPIITFNPCLFPMMRRYCGSAGPAN